MFFLRVRAARPAFGTCVAAYAVASVGVIAATAYAVRHLTVAVLEQAGPVPVGSARHLAPTMFPATEGKLSAPQSFRREGAMSLLAERGDGAWAAPSGEWRRAREYEPGEAFPASSRGFYQSFGPRRRDGWDDDEERPFAASTYRTVCVRLCDGYYFPISFAVTADRLDRDRNVCASRCGTQGRLFVHRGMDIASDDMVDLQGRPYRNLPTAFRYRTEYVPSCKCQPDPWEAASLDRHRSYALAAAARKGDRDAAKELQALQTKMKADAKLATKESPAPVAGMGGAPSPAGAARQAEIAKSTDGDLMLLGGGGAPKDKSQPGSSPTWPRSDGDWRRRTFDPGFGGR